MIIQRVFSECLWPFLVVLQPFLSYNLVGESVFSDTSSDSQFHCECVSCNQHAPMNTCRSLCVCARRGQGKNYKEDLPVNTTLLHSVTGGQKHPRGSLTFSAVSNNKKAKSCQNIGSAGSMCTSQTGDAELSISDYSHDLKKMRLVECGAMWVSTHLSKLIIITKF